MLLRHGQYSSHTYTLAPAAHSHPSILAKAKKHRCDMMARGAAAAWRALPMWSAISWVCRVGGSSSSGLNVDVAVLTLCASEPTSPPRDCALSPSRDGSHLLACPAANAANICTLLRQATRHKAAGHVMTPSLSLTAPHAPLAGCASVLDSEAQSSLCATSLED
jgi:hypothetical protein